jgi:predicted GIY-YIG superfamily endonuclease
MPRTKIDYSNTIIYKLCCKDITITDIYVGHTTDMRRRKNRHKSDCYNKNTNNYNNNVYKFIRDNGGWNNWDMIEIERFEAIDTNDAKKKERYYIETLKATLNMDIPLRTKKEYYEDNKKYHNECRKKNYENNKEKILKQMHQYYENNKEIIHEKITCKCGCIVCKSSLNRHQQTKKHIKLMANYPKRSDIITRQSSGLVDTAVI